LIDVTYIDHMGTDLSVVNAARVSFGKKSGWANFKSGDAHRGVLHDKDRKLIHYLAEHKHLSPFGHCFASFHIKAPIFVARQLVKHKFLRWNEISRRYVDSEPEFYEPDEWRGRNKDKKQGSDGVVDTEGMAHEEKMIAALYADALSIYKSLTYSEYGINVCPEQARMILPQSMMTEWYWSGSLDALADMCNLRCTSDTQLETRLVANQICDSMKKLFPVSWFALRLEK
jgi:thymidylate synthase (FAD)